MVSFVTRKDGKIYRQRFLSVSLQDLVNNVKLPKKDEDHLKAFYNDVPDGIIAPFGSGLIVIDMDTNTIISYQSSFVAGTIQKGEENENLTEFYKEGLVLVDSVDYMLDLKPFKHDIYNSTSSSDGKLVMDVLKKLGFELSNNDEIFWDFWFKNVSK
jgi:hypothetical protein